MSDETPKSKPPRKTRSAAKPPPERKARGFLRAAELTPAALKSTGARRGFAELRLLTEWRAVVGEALADICQPVKVGYGRSAPGLGATLVVATEGARAPEVDMQKTRIIDRVNAYYGYRAVSRLSIDQRRGGRQAMATGFAEEATGFEGPPVETTPAPGVTDERLALALGRLGANVRRKAAEAATDDDRSTE